MWIDLITMFLVLLHAVAFLWSGKIQSKKIDSLEASVDHWKDLSPAGMFSHYEAIKKMHDDLLERNSKITGDLERVQGEYSKFKKETVPEIIDQTAKTTIDEMGKIIESYVGIIKDLQDTLQKSMKDTPPPSPFAKLISKALNEKNKRENT